MNNRQSFAATLGFIFALAWVFVWPAKHARAQLGTVTSVSRTGDRLDLGLGHDKMIVRVCTADMIRVDYQPNGQSTPETPCVTAADWPLMGELLTGAAFGAGTFLAVAP